MKIDRHIRITIVNFEENIDKSYSGCDLMEIKKANIVCGVIAYGTVYLLVRYGMCLVMPFIIAYVLAWTVRPIAVFLIKYLKIPDNIAVTIVMTGTLTVVFLIAAGICIGFGDNIHYIWQMCIGIIEDTLVMTRGVCEGIERKIGLEDGCIFAFLENWISQFDYKGKVGMLAENSLSMAGASAEWIVSFIIVVVASFYYIRDKDKIAVNRRSLVFGREINKVLNVIYVTGIAYIKAQIIIMFCVIIICYAGFLLAGLSHPLVTAVFAGVLDAFPLLGIGIVTIPMFLYYIIMGNIKAGAITFIVFIICYGLRQVMEPKIMGENAGISPLMTMFTIYLGYRLFGFLGVLTGPFAYIAAEEIRKMLMASRKEGCDEN